jgi:argininosuccinate lyase
VLLPAVAGMVGTLTFHPERLEGLAPRGFSLATDVADWLVRQHVPFASAHHLAGATVRYCEQAGIELSDLTPAMLAEISTELGPGVLEVLTVAGSVGSRDGRGGTAEVRVRDQLAELEQVRARLASWAGTPDRAPADGATA